MVTSLVLPSTTKSLVLFTYNVGHTSLAIVYSALSNKSALRMRMHCRQRSHRNVTDIPAK